MTRAERIEQYLRDYENDVMNNDIDRALAAAQILAIADDRRYLMLGDVAEILSRSRSTVLSWVDRGTHDFPRPIGRSSAGMIWDGEQIDTWAAAHPALVHA